MDYWQKGFRAIPADRLGGYRSKGAFSMACMKVEGRSEIGSDAQRIHNIMQARAKITASLIALNAAQAGPHGITQDKRLSISKIGYASMEASNAANAMETIRAARREMRAKTQSDTMTKLTNRALEAWREWGSANPPYHLVPSRKNRACSASEVAFYQNPKVLPIGSMRFMREFVQDMNGSPNYVRTELSIPADYAHTRAAMKEFAPPLSAAPIAMQTVYIAGGIRFIRAIMVTRFKLTPAGNVVVSSNVTTSRKAGEFAGMKMGYYATSTRTLDLHWAFSWDATKAQAMVEEKIIKAAENF